jgi:hypothetical protein
LPKSRSEDEGHAEHIRGQATMSSAKIVAPEGFGCCCAFRHVAAFARCAGIELQAAPRGLIAHSANETCSTLSETALEGEKR